MLRVHILSKELTYIKLKIVLCSLQDIHELMNFSCQPPTLVLHLKNQGRMFQFRFDWNEQMVTDWREYEKPQSHSYTVEYSKKKSRLPKSKLNTSDVLILIWAGMTDKVRKISYLSGWSQCIQCYSSLHFENFWSGWILEVYQVSINHT
jgi:hypothetical protein